MNGRLHVHQTRFLQTHADGRLDLAAFIELEAYKRYTQFAERLGSRATDDAGAVFQSMAVNENKHCEQLAERRLALFHDTPPKVRLDDVFDVEAPISARLV